MKIIESRKDDIFKRILSAVDKDIKLSDNREAKIVSLTFENTFDVVNKLVDAELRKSYIKKSKSIKQSSSSRLDSIK